MGIARLDKIHGYHIEKPLGKGGMADVYLGTQLSLDRPVAIKILNGSLITDKLIQEQFHQESKLIAKLQHPNIIQVIEQGNTQQNRPFFVMPYVKSVPLSVAIKREDIGFSRKLDMALQLCRALVYAHRNGVIHRDVKPDNVLVDYEGHVFLVDFGIAGYFKTKDTQSAPTAVMGTEAYMAPEVFQGAQHATPASDIYSLGVVLHQLFTGYLPLQVNQQSHPITVKELESLIFNCIEPLPIKRPASMDMVYQQLLVIAQGKHLQRSASNAQKLERDIPAQYQLLDVLSESAWGSSYLVKDPKHQRLLVIKKLPAKLMGLAQATNEKLMHTRHPHLARILGTGKNEKHFILVTEYCAAGNLADRLTQAFSLNEWVHLAQQLCSALSCAHGLQVTHGNLRPEKVLFAESHHVKLTGFGFPTQQPNTQNAAYNSHLMKQGKQADIYALGVILFHMLCGKLPRESLFNWRNHWALRKTPKKLRKVLLKLTQKSPAKNFHHIDDVIKSLEAFYNTQSTFVESHP